MNHHLFGKQCSLGKQKSPIITAEELHTNLNGASPKYFNHSFIHFYLCILFHTAGQPLSKQINITKNLYSFLIFSEYLNSRIIYSRYSSLKMSILLSFSSPLHSSKPVSFFLLLNIKEDIMKNVDPQSAVSFTLFLYTL